MATNVIFDTVSTLSLPVPDGTESGDALVLFGMLPVLALTDEGDGGNDDNFATCLFAPSSVVDIAVKGEDGAGNAAVSVGELLYVDTDGEINVDLTNGTPYGIALEAVTSGATDTIRVLLLPAFVPAA